MLHWRTGWLRRWIMGYREFAWLWFAVLINLTVGERSSVAVWDVVFEGCGVGLHGPTLLWHGQNGSVPCQVPSSR